MEAELRALGRLDVRRIGDNVVARTDLGRPRRLLLAGHLDTVPANGNARPRLDGDTLWGLGSADMKGGLAVMLDLAAGVTTPAVDVTWVFYAAEEVAREHNGLLQIEAVDPALLRADAAILGEPTGAVIEAGCQGVLKAEVVLVGARAHTARPWMGVNALHRMGPVLDLLASGWTREPVIDGCRYREAAQAVRAESGVATNVVPDRAALVINHRFAPDRDEASAEAQLREWLGPLLDPGRGDSLAVVDSSPAAPPNLTHPLLEALVRTTGAAPRAKLGWTDVAFFTERGVPAVNFGPGDPELAHTADERVTGSDLQKARSCLESVLTAGS